MESIEKTSRITEKQVRALHLLFEHIAETLNDAGYDMKKTLKAEIEIPWTKDRIKEFLWKPVQEAYVGKKSTKELNTKEVTKIYEVINRHFGEKFGIHVPFPSIEEILYENDPSQN
jgi:phosphoenolpyruvate carboxylase